jgi:hypothetical protein
VLNERTRAEIQDLDSRYAAAVSELDDEWKAPAKQQLYTKPSAHLLNMRAMLKGMIKARHLIDVELLGKLIEAQEQRESLDASTKMQSDYEVADMRLADLYRAERTGIEGKAECRMSGLIRLKEMDLRPVCQRLDNLRRVREVALANQKKVSNLDTSKGVSPLHQQQPLKVTAATVPRFVQNPRLTVPAFAPKKRRVLASTLPGIHQIHRPKTSPNASRTNNF